MDHRFIVPITKPRETDYGVSFHICQSRKLKRSITAFSNLSFDNMLIYEMDPEVIWYCERPLENQVVIDGKNYEIKPDFYVQYKSGAEYFDWICYTSSDMEKEIDHIKSWCRQMGYLYRIRTAVDIYIGDFYIRNIKYLFARSCRNHLRNASIDKVIKSFLEENGYATIGQLIEHGLISYTDGMTYISDLYYRGVIQLSDILNESISFKTEVSLYAR